MLLNYALRESKKVKFLIQWRIDGYKRIKYYIQKVDKLFWSIKLYT